MAVFTLDENRRIYQLECLRGFAALYVVLHHTLQAEAAAIHPILGLLLRFGQEAVILFFVTSGYVIHYASQRKAGQTVASYFADRAIRIYPIFLVCLSLSYACASIVAGRWLDADLAQLIGNILMLQDRQRDGTLVLPYMGNSPLWSLSYEAFFYVVYAIVSRALTQRYQIVFVAVTAVFGTMLMVFSPSTFARFLAYLLIWWTGVELCRFDRDYRAKWGLVTCLACAAVIAIFWAAYAVLGKTIANVDPLGSFPILELRHFAFGVLCVLALLAWSKLGWLGFKAAFGIFVYVAPISYAVYVIHYPLMVTLRGILGERDGFVAWVSTFALMMALAWVLEKPFQKTVVRYLRPPRGNFPNAA